MKKIYFASDIHLNKSNKLLNQKFINWLNDLPSDTDKIYLLGDIFDAWHPAYLEEKWCQQITQALKLNSKRFKIEIMLGNHDFLLNQQFATTANIKLLTKDDYLINNNIIIAHGDTLATDDKPYQMLRKIIRAKITHIIYQILPLKTQIKIIQTIKKNSKGQNYNKAGITQTGIDRLHQKYPIAKQLICGHFHQSTNKNYQTTKGQINVITLANWDENYNEAAIVFSQ